MNRVVVGGRSWEMWAVRVVASVGEGPALVPWPCVEMCRSCGRTSSPERHTLS